MLRKLNGIENSEIELKKKAIEKIKGGVNFPGDLHNLLCSQWCERYCGKKVGMDGIQYSGQKTYR